MKKAAFWTILFVAFTPSLLLALGGSGPWAEGAYYPSQLDGRDSANVYNNTQAGFDAGQMDSPSGNTRNTNVFTSTTNTVFTTNVSFSNNITTNITVTNAGITLITNRIITTNIAVSTNIVSSVITNTDLVSAGAANVVSGVMGFAVRGGTPSSYGGGSSASGGTSTTGTSAASSSTGSAGSGSSGTVDNIALDSSLNYFAIYVNGDVFLGKTAAGINLNTKRVSGALINGVGGLTYQVVTNISVTSTTGTLSNSVLSVPNATASGYFNAKIKNNKTPFIFKGAGAITVNSAAAVASPSGTYPFNMDGIKSSGLTTSGYAQ
ncbi:MAG: hypothetical protein ACKOKC_16485 [Chthoniobacterales bacterium]